jgi:(p)ppGpp synthase/HD superfamily hydrolase
LSATLNKAGSALYKSVAVMFIAEVYGVGLHFREQLIIVVAATASAISGAGVPGMGMVTILIVLNAVGMRAQAQAGIALVVGVDRLLTGLARCCKPAPPDPIVGFVTRGKGITIHRATCANVERIRAREPERLIEADWGAARDQLFPVDIVVEASDRQGLLRDISELLSREKINVTAVNTQTRQHQARMAFTLEVESIGQLKRALQLARDIPGVFAADRR